MKPTEIIDAEIRAFTHQELIEYIKKTVCEAELTLIAEFIDKYTLIEEELKGHGDIAIVLDIIKTIKENAMKLLEEMKG